MFLIKTNSGILENENYYTKSPLTHFMGDGVFVRDDNEFTLSTGTVERNLPYDDCVIHIKKKPTKLVDLTEFWFYLREEYRNASLIESRDGNKPSASEWLLVRHRGFSEYYSFADGKWTHLGGTQHTKYPFQGIKVVGNAPLTITDYKVYSSPYCVFKNIPPTAECTLYSNGELVDTTIANENAIAEFCVKYPRKNLEIVAQLNGDVILRESIEEVSPGDEFLFSIYNIGLRYGNRNLTPLKHQMLTADIERIELVNFGDKEYNNVELSLLADEEKIKLSWTQDFSGGLKKLNTPLGAYEVKPFYAKINPIGTSFFIKHFGIFLGGGE